MDKFMNCGPPGTKTTYCFGGIRENFPEEGMLGPELKNHTRVRPRDKLGRECQVEGVKILLDALVKWSGRHWEWPMCVCVCVCVCVCE